MKGLYWEPQTGISMSPQESNRNIPTRVPYSLLYSYCVLGLPCLGVPVNLPLLQGHVQVCALKNRRDPSESRVPRRHIYTHRGRYTNIYIYTHIQLGGFPKLGVPFFASL